MSKDFDYDEDEDIDVDPDQPFHKLADQDAQVAKIQAVVRGRIARREFAKKRAAAQNPESAEAYEYRREQINKLVEEEQWRRINQSKQVVNFEDSKTEKFERQKRTEYARMAAMKEQMRRINEMKFEEMKHLEQREQNQKDALEAQDYELERRMKDKNRDQHEQQTRNFGKRMSMSIQAAAKSRSNRVNRGAGRISSADSQGRITQGSKGAGSDGLTALAEEDVGQYEDASSTAPSGQTSKKGAKEVGADGKPKDGEKRAGYCAGGNCSVM